MHITHVNLSKGFRGGERQTALLIEGLAARQIKQHLIVRRDSVLIDILKHTPGLIIHPISKPYILHLIYKLDTDILHAHEAKAAQWCYLHHCLRHKPYIITRRVPHKPKKNFFTHRVYRHAAALVALSTAIRDVLKHYNEQLQIQIIPSMYQKVLPDAKHVQELRQQYSQIYGTGRIIIGHIGALVDHHKGQSVILEAARMLQHSHPQWLFLLVGDGPDRSKLTKQAADLSNVCFAGHQSQITDYFALFDYFIFPSRHEGLGSSLLDAIFHQLPIIASRIDGITDVIEDQQTGLLIDPGQADQLAKMLTKIIIDKNLSNKLVHQASLTLERYSVDTVTKQYVEIYQTVIRAKRNK